MPLSTLTLPKPETISRRIRSSFTSPSGSSSSSRAPSINRTPTPPTLYISDPAYIHTQSAAAALQPEAPSLRTLNASLAALATIFPNIEAEVFREMLCHFDEESRLQVVTEALLKGGGTWVRGRWKVGAQGAKPRSERQETVEDVHHEEVSRDERFRSEAYKKAVRTALYAEFKSISHSAVDAVLAEHNSSYTKSRPTLLALAAKSWKASLTALFKRRKAKEDDGGVDEKHAMVLWIADGSEKVPALRVTESWELNEELFESLVGPKLRRLEEERQEMDQRLAMQLNEREAEEMNALHECGCCFAEVAFEEVAACDQGGHVVCLRCVRQTVKEVLFGQGWAKSMDKRRGTLQCLVPMDADQDVCPGCLPSDLVRRALVQETGGDETWRHLQNRVAMENLRQAGLPIVRCPFCPYAEVDDLDLSSIHSRSLHLRRSHQSPFLPSPTTLLVLMMLLALSPFLFTAILTSSVLTPQSIPQIMSLIAKNYLIPALLRHTRLHRPSRFRCPSATCLRHSCLRCHLSFPPNSIHVCHETARLALRQHVERAMSSAIKRTCPRCNLSFVKASGCNKLTCVCGYSMCYLCRGEIGSEGYRHFCEHFRPRGGACTECGKCDLYRAEDEDAVVREAGITAEREWRRLQAVERRSKATHHSEREQLALDEIDDLGPQDMDGWSSIDDCIRNWTWEKALDWVVENLVEVES